MVGWLVGWPKERERERNFIILDQTFSYLYVLSFPFFSQKRGLFDKVCVVIEERGIEISFGLRRKKNRYGREILLCVAQLTEAVRSSSFYDLTLADSQGRGPWSYSPSSLNPPFLKI